MATEVSLHFTLDSFTHCHFRPSPLLGPFSFLASFLLYHIPLHTLFLLSVFTARLAHQTNINIVTALYLVRHRKFSSSIPSRTFRSWPLMVRGLRRTVTEFVPF